MYEEKNTRMNKLSAMLCPSSLGQQKGVCSSTE